MPVFNMPFILSVVGAFLASATVAYLYVWPAVRALPRFDALRLLAAFHAFRFFGMNFLVTWIRVSGTEFWLCQQSWMGRWAHCSGLALFSMAALSRRWSIAISSRLDIQYLGTLDLLNAYYMVEQRSSEIPVSWAQEVYVPRFMSRCCLSATC